jgi:hypothetical protein
VFVYRGKEYERLSDFSSRTLNQLPNAELMNKLTPPGEDIMESPHQCILLLAVSSSMYDYPLPLPLYPSFGYIHLALTIIIM